MEDLKIKINEYEVIVEEFKQKERELEKREKQLKLTIETLQNASKDPRDLSQLKISEKLLTEEIDRLKKSQTANDSKPTSIKELELKLIKAENEIKELKSQNTKKDAANAALMGEVENVSAGRINNTKKIDFVKQQIMFVTLRSSTKKKVLWIWKSKI